MKKRETGTTFNLSPLPALLSRKSYFFSYRHVLLSRQWFFPKSPRFHAFHPCGMIQLSRFILGNLSSDLNFFEKCFTM